MKKECSDDDMRKGEQGWDDEVLIGDGNGPKRYES